MTAAASCSPESHFAATRPIEWLSHNENCTEVDVIDGQLGSLATAATVAALTAQREAGVVDPAPTGQKEEREAEGK